MSHLPHPFIEGQPPYDPEERYGMSIESLMEKYRKEGMDAIRKAGLLVIDDAPMPGTEAWERLMEYQRQLESKRKTPDSSNSKRKEI